MTSTMQKNILAVLLIIASVALLITGVFSFFSDRGDADATGTVGTVQIEIPATGIAYTGLQNINPGDHDWNLAKSLGFSGWNDPKLNANPITEGSTHSMSLEVKNVGNKSVKVRNTIDLVVSFANDDIVQPGDDYMFFLTSFPIRSADGATELAKKYFLFTVDGKTVQALYLKASDAVVSADGYYIVDASDAPIVTSAPDYANLTTCTGIRYIVFDADPAKGHILKGVGDDAEDEATDGVAGTQDYKYYVGLKAQADNRYQGATLDIMWSVEAIQHRNTDSTLAWTKIAEGMATAKVPARDEKADGNPITP